MLQEKLSIESLSTGELFRRAIRGRTALGNRVRRYVTQGLLVPDGLVVRVMTTHLGPRRLRAGVVLDGFPRTAGQARGLDRFLQRHRQPLDAAIYLVCSPNVLVRRLSGRQVCSRCGAIYHVRNMPPRRSGVCDRCRGVLVVREDDAVATIKKRLRVDRTQAKPLLDYYRRRALLHRLDGNGASHAVFGRVMRLLRRRGWWDDRTEDI